MKWNSQQDFNKIPMKGLVPESSATAPTTPRAGQLWHDASVDKIKAWIGGAWVALDLDTNTTYGSGTSAEITAGSDATAKVWAANSLSAGIRSLITKTQVGLPNVDNTSDANKPISTAQAAVNSAKADLASPTFTGDPKAPTPATMDNDTSIATTAMVQARVALKADLAGAAFTGAVTVQPPTAPTNPATKSYVDNAVQGLDAKEAVRLASVSDFTPRSGLPVIDGIQVVQGDRILLKNQTNPTQNGIYSADSGAWFRAADMDTWAENKGAFVFVAEGVANADSGWVSSTDVANGTLDTTAIPWVQFSSAGVVTAGSGLEKIGNSIGIGPQGVVSTHLAVAAVPLDGNKVTGVLPIALGGTGSTTATTARNRILAVGVKTVPIPALTAGAWLAVDTGVVYITVPQVTFVEASSGEQVILDYRINSSSLNLEVKSDIATTNAQFSAVVYSNEI